MVLCYVFLIIDHDFYQTTYILLQNAGNLSAYMLWEHPGIVSWQDFKVKPSEP